jgi:RNA polymerase sigma-32 factor
LTDTIGVEDAIVERIADDEIRTKRREKLEGLKEKLKTELKPKERVVYEKRIFAQDPATLQELGEELGISRERVRQLEAGIIKRFKQELAKDQQVI